MPLIVAQCRDKYRASAAATGEKNAYVSPWKDTACSKTGTRLCKRMHRVLTLIANYFCSLGKAFDKISGDSRHLVSLLTIEFMVFVIHVIPITRIGYTVNAGAIQMIEINGTVYEAQPLLLIGVGLSEKE